MAAIALVLTVAISVASLTLSFRRSVTSYYEENGFLVGDLVVSAVATEGGWLETPLPEHLAAEIQDVPGVQSVESWRALYGQMYQGHRISVTGFTGVFDPARFGAHWYREGDPARAAQAIREGRGANVSTALAERFGLRLGDRIVLDTPTGALALPIAGIVHDYSSNIGTVLVSRRLLVSHWQEPTVNRIHVILAPGFSRDAVRAAIVQRFGNRHVLKVLSMREVIDYLSKQIDRAFAFTYAIQLLVVIVTVAGIFDLLLAAIAERHRELAIWRLIGADQRTVRRSVVIESATIGALGALLGVGVGIVTAWIWIGINFRYLLGFYLEYHFALGAGVWYVTLIMAMATLTGYVAATRATRQPVLEGIRAE